MYITETDPCIEESYKSSVKNKSSKIDCLHQSLSMVVDIWTVMGPQQYMASSQTHISHSHAQYCQAWLILGGAYKLIRDHNNAPINSLINPGSLSSHLFNHAFFFLTLQIHP